MYQRISRPDRYVARCGHMDAVVTERRIADAPPFMRGLRVLFVADAHVLSRTTRDELDALAAKIARAEPHLLLLGGDYADRAEDSVRFFDALAGLSVPLGCFGVLGNNDAEAWAGRIDALRAVMARAGCALLVNRAEDIPLKDGAIRVGGVDEYRYGAPRTVGFWPEEPRKGLYRILLSHYPVLVEPRPELMLCGHTHGGQFNLLGLTPFAIGFERFNRPRRASVAISGLRDIGDMKLLVSKGIGASRLQLRVGVRPEIDLLVFE